jgi:RNA-directed DNA polymerase
VVDADLSKYFDTIPHDEAWQAHVINYADDFVILSRGYAAEALTWTDRVMTRLGLTLNRTKTRLCDARQERFDFLGYSFGPHCFRQTGRGFIGASPSKTSVQRLKDKVGETLVPGNVGPWQEVSGSLNRLVRGWCGYFSPGSHYATDRVVEAHVYDRVRNFLVRRHNVRNFLVRRHKMPARSIGPFTMEAVFGALGVVRPRLCRRSGVMS